VLKLKCDILLSTSAFKFNLRRYTWVQHFFPCDDCRTHFMGMVGEAVGQGLTLVRLSAQRYTLCVGYSGLSP
jgi:hypothetical protein